MFIYSYVKGSKSVKNLVDSIKNLLIIKRKNSKFKGSANKYVINWGCASLPAEVLKCRVLNKPLAVGIARNKLNTFLLLKEAQVSIPRFTTNLEEARSWGTDICARATVTGHEGAGLSIHKADAPDIPSVPLYTEYVKKKREFRVHVFKGQVLDFQEKKKDKDFNKDVRDTRVRNTANGYVFCRTGVQIPNVCLEEAIKAVNAVGLDFGGVDVVYNEHYKKAYVLEINTAPGIEGTTVSLYRNAFNNDYNNVQGA